jgi:hypothetical protein
LVSGDEWRMGRQPRLVKLDAIMSFQTHSPEDKF